MSADRSLRDGPGSPPVPRSQDAPAPLDLDLSALKALAHPLRLRMYELLADRGPGTASQLAAALGESSGTTSYHLRVLAEHGLLEEDADRGDRRDRWWRVRPGGYQLDATPAELAALRDEVAEVLARHQDLLRDRVRPEGATRVAVQFHAFPLPRPEASDAPAGAEDDDG